MEGQTKSEDILESELARIKTTFDLIKDQSSNMYKICVPIVYCIDGDGLLKPNDINFLSYGIQGEKVLDLTKFDIPERGEFASDVYSLAYNMSYIYSVAKENNVEINTLCVYPVIEEDSPYTYKYLNDVSQAVFHMFEAMMKRANELLNEETKGENNESSN